MSEFKPCDEERYMEMLGVLPPLDWVSKGFLVSEPLSHRECTITKVVRNTYQAMVRRTNTFDGKDQYFESTSGLTRAEWCALDSSEITVVTFELRSHGKLEGVFATPQAAEAYATELRGIGATNLTVNENKTSKP